MIPLLRSIKKVLLHITPDPLIFTYSYLTSLHINSLTKTILYLNQLHCKLTSLHLIPTYKISFSLVIPLNGSFLASDGVIFIAFICRNHHSNIPKQILTRQHLYPQHDRFATIKIYLHLLLPISVSTCTFKVFYNQHKQPHSQFPLYFRAVPSKNIISRKAAQMT